MSAQPNRRVLVIGAGPGGLTAALALSRVGIDVALFERAPELPVPKSGLGVSGKILKGLSKLGVAETLKAAGTVLQAHEVRSARGELLMRVPHGEVGESFGTPTLSLTRKDLHFTLAEALPEGILQLGRQCTGVEQDEDGVTATFADGSTERGALLIGADGGRSLLRKYVFGDADVGPRYTGLTTWRSMIKVEGAIPDDTSRSYLGRGKMWVMFPVGGQVIYWGLSKIAPPDGRDEPGTVKRFLFEQLEDFDDVARMVVETTPEEAIQRTDLYDRNPDETWRKGRVALLGDAVHMTTPFVGQGAGLAIEDGIVLAKELSLTDGLRQQDALPQVLESYERARLPRTSKIVLTSRRLGRIYTLPNPALATVRDAVFRIVPSRSMRSGMERDFAQSV